MSREKFDDECKGCKPVLIDPKTMQKLPEDHRDMKAISAVWETLTQEQKTSFHNACCLNSRKPEGLEVFSLMQERMLAAIHCHTSN